jgi:hypothetical protein
MYSELIPIKAGQHSVVLVPRATTDLPFFYYTKQKAALEKDIEYEGQDFAGRPMRWSVTPSRSPKIGAPAIEASEVWYRLVKPTIDTHFNQDEGAAYVIPLGRLRECLRAIDWTEGGFEARRLLKALRQIGAAWCIADLWIPTTKTNEQGETLFTHVKGEFSKMTIYAIGSKHITEEELKDGKFNFDFDLDDTIYILLNPIEAQIQKSQPQRYLDNDYMFSVKPAAQRWYQLVSAKIFGVVKNKGAYCEIKYSWYVKHHHTLKRHYQRFRVVEQMNEIVKDHLANNYISKVEYRKFKEPDQELDWVIRYYPGEAAKESIGKILKYQYNKRSSGRKERVSVKAAPTPAQRTIQPAEQGSAVLDEAFQPIPLERSLTTEEYNLTSRLIIDFGITAAKAQELVGTHLEQTRLQLEAYSFRKPPTDKAGWIIRAIEQSYTLPEGYLKKTKQQRAELAAQSRREAIDACSLCNISGQRIRRTKDEQGRESIAFRECTHNRKIESSFPDFAA